MSTTDIILIIGAISANLILVINAIGSARRGAAQKAAAFDTSEKLEVIHELTNGGMAALKAKLAAALSRIDSLEALLAERLIK